MLNMLNRGQTTFFTKGTQSQKFHRLIEITNDLILWLCLAHGDIAPALETHYGIEQPFNYFSGTSSNVIPSILLNDRHLS
jgi:hypothetical protein